MVDKYHLLSDRFKAMYLKGASYEEMSKELDVYHMTLRDWRKRMGLPPRRDRTKRSWKDIPIGAGLTPKEILSSIAAEIGITKNDIEFILMRVDKLKSKGLIKGRSFEHVILAAAFLYLRWEGSGRRPVSATRFVDLSEDFGLSTSELFMTCRLFTSAGLYPRQHLRPESLLERSWKSLQDKYSLPETVKSRILALMKDPELVGKTSSTVVAGCTYVASLESGNWILQDDLAEFFGITQVSLRNILNCLRKNNPSARMRPLDMVLKRRSFE